MNGNAFGGYNKPNFEVKNLTSDMWEPITTSNNYSAYTPERPAVSKNDTPVSTRERTHQKTVSSPAASVERKKQEIKPKKKSKSINLKPQFKTKSKDIAKNKQKPVKDNKSISDGNVQQVKPSKPQKTPSKRQINIAEKRREKSNRAFVRLVKMGKTTDEARMIINRRKIRHRRIKTLSTVGLFTVFAVCFLLSYSYFRGAEIKEIRLKGDEVYTETEIFEAGNISVGLNMLTIREKELNNNVTKLLPFISKIDVDYQLPDVLELNVVSTKEQLILKCDRKYICVDSQDKVVSDKKKKLSEGQFLVQGLVEQEYTVGDDFIVSEENAERYKIAREFAKAAEKADTLNYGVLDLKDLNDIKFTFRSKIRLYLGDSTNIASKLEKAIGIMNSADIGDKTGYINLKYDIGAYFMEGTME